MIKLTTKFVKPAVLTNFKYFSTDKSNQPWKVDDSAPEEKTNSFVAKNLGLSQFLTRTYNTTALSIVGALGAGYLSSSLPFVLMNPGMTAIGGAIAAIASFIATSKMKQNIV